MKDRVRVLSGIRASHSSLHLGNLLGAINGMIDLQNNPKYETFYMVADLHGITTPFDPKTLRKNRMAVAMDYLSSGIDPNKSALFLQSEVSQHAELAYYLSVAITSERLLHLPAYKEKIKQYKGYPKTMALLNYPVLMAADILLYKAGVVPIAKDQLPHLEISRVIARNMNKNYNLHFPEPRQYSTRELMVPSLSGEGKMSKSKQGSAIFLNDSLEDIRRKIAKIPTDQGKGKKIPSTGGVNNLLVFVELLIGKDRRKELEHRYLSTGLKYSDIKEELVQATYRLLKPIQEKRKVYEMNPVIVREILDRGAERARRVAKETLKEVKEKMGLTP